MTRTTVTRIAPGEYEVRHGDLVVSISRFDHLDYEHGQWVARAEWSGTLYSDPIVYLADAKRWAEQAIQEASA